MADPLLDQINEVTLKEIRSNVIYDAFFNDSNWLSPVTRDRYRVSLGGAKWKREMYDRQVQMGVPPSQAFHVVQQVEIEKRREAARNMRKFLDKRYQKHHGF